MFLQLFLSPPGPSFLCCLIIFIFFLQGRIAPDLPLNLLFSRTLTPFGDSGVQIFSSSCLKGTDIPVTSQFSYNHNNSNTQWFFFLSRPVGTVMLSVICQCMTSEQTFTHQQPICQFGDHELPFTSLTKRGNFSLRHIDHQVWSVTFKTKSQVFSVTSVTICFSQNS